MQKQINFIGGADINGVSGGYLYNSHLIKMLKAKNHKIHYFNSKQSISTLNPAFNTIVDSLMVTEVLEELLSLDKQPILLYHLPPELNGANCLKENADNLQLLASLVNNSLIVTTGKTSFEYMQINYQLRKECLHMIKPGLINNWRKKNNYKTLPRRLLVVASLQPNKGYELLIPLLASLADLDWTLKFYGDVSFDPVFFSQIMEQIEYLNLQHRIFYGGVLSQIKLNMAMVSSDLLLQLSSFETYSMVTNEAIYAGLPVLSTKTGNHEEFIHSGLVLYLENICQQHCVDVLQSLLTDETQYHQLRPIQLHKPRSWLQVADDFDALLEDV